MMFSVFDDLMSSDLFSSVVRAMGSNQAFLKLFLFTKMRILKVVGYVLKLIVNINRQHLNFVIFDVKKSA